MESGHEGIDKIERRSTTAAQAAVVRCWHRGTAKWTYSGRFADAEMQPYRRRVGPSLSTIEVPDKDSLQPMKRHNTALAGG